MDILNKLNTKRGAMDGSEGVFVRVYSATYAVDEEFKTKVIFTFEELVEFIEESLLAQEPKMLTIAVHRVTKSEFNKSFPREVREWV